MITEDIARGMLLDPNSWIYRENPNVVGPPGKYILQVVLSEEYVMKSGRDSVRVTFRVVSSKWGFTVGKTVMAYLGFVSKAAWMWDSVANDPLLPVGTLVKTDIQINEYNGRYISHVGRLEPVTLRVRRTRLRRALRMWDVTVSFAPVIARGVTQVSRAYLLAWRNK